MNLFKKLSLRLKFFLGSLFYLSYAPKAFLYTRQRDRIEREFPIPQTESTFDKPGKLLRAEPKPRGVRIYFEQSYRLRGGLIKHDCEKKNKYTAWENEQHL